MKQYIVKTLLAGAAVLALAACDDNSWNEDYLDGFTTPDNTDVQTVEYTLTADDYKSIASNKTNQALAGDNLAAALAAVGTSGKFSRDITPEEYLPAFLSSTSFPYFALSNGSAVKVTYNVATDEPEELARMNAAASTTLTDDDYKTIYGSDENYANALSPSNGLNNIPAILKAKYPDAEQGDYVVVNYNWSITDPVFGTVVPDEPVTGFEMTSALDGIATGDVVTVRGYITGLCTRGYIVTDKSGSILNYIPSGFDPSAYPIGSQIEVTAPVSAYNKGWQLDGANIESETVTPATEAYTYPAPTVLDGAALDQVITRTDNELAQYVQFTGIVAVNGNNINIQVAGAETAQGSAYFALDGIKADLTDGAQVTVRGYVIAIAGTRYVNTVVNEVVAGAAAAPRHVAAVASEGRTALYYFNGSNWSQPANATALSGAQCQEIAGYTTLTAAQADANLPIFLKVNFPYATEGTQRYVVYDEYKTGYVARLYIFNGTEWAQNNNTETTTLQFVRNNGQWKADPSVVIVLPSGRNQELSMLYFQTCTDWVYENIDVPLGSTSITSGLGYVTSFGNNEYYSGTSAYQGNVDLRADKAAAQYPDGYAGMTDAEIQALMKQRFETEVMPAALAIIHPDAMPMDGVQVTYTITFGTYDGANATETIRYEVTAPGTFTFLDCTWND